MAPALIPPDAREMDGYCEMVSRYPHLALEVRAMVEMGLGFGEICRLARVEFETVDGGAKFLRAVRHLQEQKRADESESNRSGKPGN